MLMSIDAQIAMLQGSTALASTSQHPASWHRARKHCHNLLACACNLPELWLRLPTAQVPEQPAAARPRGLHPLRAAAGRGAGQRVWQHYARGLQRQGVGPGGGKVGPGPVCRAMCCAGHRGCVCCLRAGGARGACVHACAVLGGETVCCLGAGPRAWQWLARVTGSLHS
jgi:hypothetical protein